jgi:ParB family chromosome partitioning protein
MTPPAARPKGLGRGLNSLLDTGNDAPGLQGGDRLATKPLDQLVPGRYQPRTRMDEGALAELAQSISAQGLIQPILVRPLTTPDRYEIIAGERRWRAARLAGLTEVPVVIREVPDKATLAMALIENIQREDLNPLEEARGLQRLIDEFSLTHQAVAEAVGRSRAAVTNLLRLLNLEPPVQEMLFDGQIDMGHARALLALPPATQLAEARVVVAQNLSVRATEARVAAILSPPPASTNPARSTKARDGDVARLEEELAESLGTRVEIRQGSGGRGRLVLSYDSLDHLDGLIERIRGPL